MEEKFPKALSKFPDINCFQFEEHSRNDGDYNGFLRQRLLIGNAPGRHLTKIWAYMSKTKNCIKFRNSKNSREEPGLEVIGLRESFRSVLPSNLSHRTQRHMMTSNVLLSTAFF